MEHKTEIKSSIDACIAKLNSLNEYSHQNTKQNSLNWFQSFCNSLVNVILLYTKHSPLFKHEKNFRASTLLHILHLKEILSLIVEIFTAEDESKITLQEARNFAVKQLHWCLNGLLQNLETHSKDSDGEESFVRWMDLALDKLLDFDFNDGRETVVNVLNEFRTIVEEVLSHALSVAQIASEEYNAIKGSCQSVLEALEALETEIRKNEWNIAMCNLFVDVCNDKLCVLENKINVTVLKLCLSVFCDYKTPLECLHSFCLSDAEKTEAEVDNLVAEFDLHVDKLMQIGFFAVACSTNISRVTQIKSCLVSLEALEVELVPALTANTLDRNNQKLQYSIILKDFWIGQVKILQNAVYCIIDPTAFSNIVHDELKNNLDELETTTTLTKSLFTPFLVKTRILIDFFRVSSSDMPENEVSRTQPAFKRVRIAFTELNYAIETLLSGNNSDENVNKRIIKRCKIVVSMIKQLWLSTNEEKENSLKTMAGKTDASAGLVGNRLIDHCIVRGQEILKERSILKHSETTNKIKSVLLLSNKGKRKETPLLKRVLQKRMNFSSSRIKNEFGFDQTIVNIVNHVSNMTKTLENK